MLMQVNFEVAGWWYIVEPEEGEENYRHDRLALATILCSVPDEMLSGLHDKRTLVVSAWEAIKRIRVRV
jgi:putative SOS response-associated peptidase YedK